MNTASTPPLTPAADHTPPHGALRYAGTCTGLALVIGMASGSLSALFLWSLDAVTSLRFAHPALIFLLPLTGVFIVWCYKRWGSEANRGNNLILERIRLQNGTVPTRMTPLIFGGSVLSHLVGASTGREGAAVQMGGSVAALLVRVTQVPQQYIRPLLVAGVAAGFSSIFGTPLAGALFAVESPTPQRPLFHLLPVAMLSSFCAHLTCLAWGAHHAVYKIAPMEWAHLFNFKMLGALALASLLFGWAGHGFLRLQQAIRTLYTHLSPPWWLPPIIGGGLLIIASQMPSLQDSLGLGTWSTRPEAVTLASAFAPEGANELSWLSKLTLTAVSLGSGFKGGEVTPLFFMGATLGNTLATVLHLAPSLFAALGFVAVFAAAAHTPLTGILVAGELFGFAFTPLFAPVCWIAHLACGRVGLFSNQFSKGAGEGPFATPQK